MFPSPVRTLGGAVDVLRKVNRKNAGPMIDIHHFHRAQDDPAELVKLPKGSACASLRRAAEIPQQTEMVRFSGIQIVCGGGDHRPDSERDARRPLDRCRTWSAWRVGVRGACAAVWSRRKPSVRVSQGPFRVAGKGLKMFNAKVNTRFSVWATRGTERRALYA